jgi:hypothetical protein
LEHHSANQFLSRNVPQFCPTETVQQAVMQVLQRRWNPTLSQYGYGFRPRRSAHHAVAQAQQYIAQGNGWVIDLDLEKSSIASIMTN